MNQTKLPEGWEKQSERFYFRKSDRKACVTSSWTGLWIGIVETPDGLAGYEVSREETALAAMLALNEKYPLEDKDDGKG